MYESRGLNHIKQEAVEEFNVHKAIIDMLSLVASVVQDKGKLQTLAKSAAEALALTDEETKKRDQAYKTMDSSEDKLFEIRKASDDLNKQKADFLALHEKRTKDFTDHKSSVESELGERAARLEEKEKRVDFDQKKTSDAHFIKQSELALKERKLKEESDRLDQKYKDLSRMQADIDSFKSKLTG